MPATDRIDVVTPVPGAGTRETETLLKRRVFAARASGGTSGDAIYDAALAVAREMSLTGDVLEYGAGTGTLIRRLTDQNCPATLTGADLLPRPDRIPDRVRWIQGDLNAPLPCRDRSFDAIISTEVIEHLENPRAVFREFSRLLKTGGRLLLTTPNQESIRSLAALIVRGHHVAFLDESYPAHLTALVRRDFERLCSETGFEPPRFAYTDDGAVPKWTAVHWQAVSGGLLRGRLFSDNVLMTTRRT